jgi:hypothetical protein
MEECFLDLLVLEDLAIVDVSEVTPTSSSTVVLAVDTFWTVTSVYVSSVLLPSEDELKTTLFSSTEFPVI